MQRNTAMTDGPAIYLLLNFTPIKNLFNRNEMSPSKLHTTVLT